MSGEELADIPIGDVVEKYIKVKAPKVRFGSTEDGDDEGQSQAEKQGRRKGKKRNGRGKGKQAQLEEADGDDQIAVEGEGEELPTQTKAGQSSANTAAEETVAPTERKEAEATTTVEEEKLVLALRRIDSLDLSDAGKFVVFSAVGYGFTLLYKHLLICLQCYRIVLLQISFFASDRI